MRGTERLFHGGREPVSFIELGLSFWTDEGEVAWVSVLWGLLHMSWDNCDVFWPNCRWAQ